MLFSDSNKEKQVRYLILNIMKSSLNRKMFNKTELRRNLIKFRPKIYFEIIFGQL